MGAASAAQELGDLPEVPAHVITLRGHVTVGTALPDHVTAVPGHVTDGHMNVGTSADHATVVSGHVTAAHVTVGEWTACLVSVVKLMMWCPYGNSWSMRKERAILSLDQPSPIVYYHKYLTLHKIMVSLTNPLY